MFFIPLVLDGVVDVFHNEVRGQQSTGASSEDNTGQNIDKGKMK